jgi:hypothetical protein
MTMLDRGHRRLLEQAVRRARRAASEGASQALEYLGVAYHEPRADMTADRRRLRNRLRARAKQLGDRRNAQGRQEITRLVEQCAYEHWHRMLFARFLAENELLIEPSGVAISLRDCRELAAEVGRPWIALASEYAVRMLPQVFRSDDAVLEVELPAEHRAELETLLEALPVDVFTASDSLGWTYQFWQADAKNAVNESEEKVGAAEMGPVTQLFTEDYMVDFLLHNTLGGWWAGKASPIVAATEDEARAKVALPSRGALPGIAWKYLRLTQNADQTWSPTAGTFAGWPTTAREITLLDPCMGSGHFLVFALELLARLRAEEENLPDVEAVSATLRDNLIGLELDERCTQIAAFNLALVAWRIAGYRVLPPLNLACSGLNVSAAESDWTALASGDERLSRGMQRLYKLFRQAPVLGSLVEPRAIWGEVLESGFAELAPLLKRAIANERSDESRHELAVTAQGVWRAAEVLAGQYTLIATNVPYLARGRQCDDLRAYCEQQFPRSKQDLATVFLERSLSLLSPGGTVAAVTPQNWLFLVRYTDLRRHLLANVSWNAIGRLGAGAFEGIGGEVVNVALVAVSSGAPPPAALFASIDVSSEQAALEKADCLRRGLVTMVSQSDQLRGPDARITAAPGTHGPLLAESATSYQGIGTSDNAQFVLKFWEIAQIDDSWRFVQTAAGGATEVGGAHSILLWENGSGRYFRHAMALKDAGRLGGWKSGAEAWGRLGVAVNVTSTPSANWYLGDMFDTTVAAIIPRDQRELAPIYCFLSSPDFALAVRQVDQALSITEHTLLKVPYDKEHWRAISEERYPRGLPQLDSPDATQWLFSGHPLNAHNALQVAVARLLGFRWPRQTRPTPPGAPAFPPDGLEPFGDADGIVCIPALQRELPAATRLRAILSAAFGSNWSGAKERDLLGDSGAASETLEEWLRDEFFTQHCVLFHQRPFVWHIWDGRPDGFSALVNYHKLAAPGGEGRRTIERLTHTYLGDWITRQRAAVNAREDGGEARLAAAEHLKVELERIIEGEPPYDLFVRWKSLAAQPIGWEPDVTDGVRMNIRPFMTARPFNARSRTTCILRTTPRIKWDKDRGKEPERPRVEYPWFWGWDGSARNFVGGQDFDGTRWNDLHYSRDLKRVALAAEAERVAGGRR